MPTHALRRPPSYVATDDLKVAVNAAVTLRRPFHAFLHLMFLLCSDSRHGFGAFRVWPGRRLFQIFIHTNGSRRGRRISGEALPPHLTSASSASGRRAADMPAEATP